VFQCLNVINKGRKLYERMFRATSITTATCQLWHATKVSTNRSKGLAGSSIRLNEPSIRSGSFAALLAF